MLANVVSSNEPSIRDYMCKLCDQKFSTMEQLDKHSREMHPAARTASQRT